MPLPPQLARVVTTREFWKRYFWEEQGDYKAFSGCTLALPIVPGFQLELSLGSMSEFSLGLRVPGGASAIEIAWDDQVHFHPHVLRWEELETFCRCMALTDAELAHPGVPLLLLNRFAPICSGDDLDFVTSSLEGAWALVEGIKDAQVRTYIERLDRRQDRFRWRKEEVGWVLGQEPSSSPGRAEIYSLRAVENADFPFAEWHTLVNAAAGRLEALSRAPWALRHQAKVREIVERADWDGLRTLPDLLRGAGCGESNLLRALVSPHRAQQAWALEVILGEGQGAVVKRLVGPGRLQPRTRYSLDIEVPEPARRFRELRLEAALQTALEEGGLGSWFNSMFSLTLWGDVELGIDIVRRTLVRLGAPSGTTIRVTSPIVRDVPLETARPEGGPGAPRLG